MLNFCGKAGAIAAICVLGLMGCSEKESLQEGSCGSRIFKEWPAGLQEGDHSRLFWVDTACGERVAAIRSIVGLDTLEKRFVLRDSATFAAGGALPNALAGAMVLQTPLRRVAVLSSAQIGYMLRLGLEDRIVAVGAGKYIADSALYYRVKGNVPSDSSRDNLSSLVSRLSSTEDSVNLSSLASRLSSIEEVSPDGMNVDYEKLMALKPDLVMTFATGGSQDDYDRMEKLGIPVMLTSEWQENSVVAKAQWLKLYGALFGAETLTDSVMREISRDASSANTESCVGPRVLSGMSYGGVWYAPGGRSYTANLIKEAGGCYLWASDTTRELRLTIEDVIALADSADLWINPGMFGTPDEILAAEPRAAHIKAFKDKKVFQNDGRKGPGGGNDFFEGAVARPKELIRNLRAQFGTSVDSTFEWYHNIF